MTTPTSNKKQTRNPGTNARRQIAGAHAKAEEGLSKVEHRNSYYNHGNKKLFIAAIVSLVGLGLQSAIAFSVFTAKSERVYFATDKNGSLIQLVALGQPNQKDAVVAQWVQTALVDTFSFNYTNYFDRLNKTTMEWFTKEGGEGLLQALDSVGVIQAIKERKMIVSLTLEHTPILVAQGPNDNGVYSWTFQANAILTYRTQTQELTNKVKFMVKVDRRSIMDNAEGLGITKVIMQRR